MDVDSLAGPSLQPFQCQVCARRFTRLENLKRHLQLHNTATDESISCAYCPATFSRRDLRRRHVKRKHPERAGQPDIGPQGGEAGAEAEAEAETEDGAGVGADSEGEGETEPEVHTDTGVKSRALSRGGAREGPPPRKKPRARGASTSSATSAGAGAAVRGGGGASLSTRATETIDEVDQEAERAGETSTSGGLLMGGEDPLAWLVDHSHSGPSAPLRPPISRPQGGMASTTGSVPGPSMPGGTSAASEMGPGGMLGGYGYPGLGPHAGGQRIGDGSARRHMFDYSLERPDGHGHGQGQGHELGTGVVAGAGPGTGGDAASSGQTWTPSAFDALLSQMESASAHGNGMEGTNPGDGPLGLERRPSTSYTQATGPIPIPLAQPQGPQPHQQPASSSQSYVVSPPHLRFSPQNTTSLSPFSKLLNPSHSLSHQSDPLADHALVLRATALFFAQATYFPFLHQPTFDSLDPAHPRALIAGIMCVGLLFAPDPPDRALADECYRRGKALMADEEQWQADLASGALALGSMQALVLHGTYAVMRRCGDETQAGLRMHAKCVELARKRGLMEPYHTPSSSTADLDELWRSAIRAESHKRTLFSIYHLDAIWYCLVSRPRSLSHLEIKHDLPLSSSFWSCRSATEWAHRALTGSLDQRKTRYIDAVRRTLAGSPADGALATANGTGTATGDGAAGLDTFGTLMVMMFHYTSLREVSGWSTMTGRMSLERFEALHSALTALEGTASFPPDSPDPLAVACEATWHICMIELCLWSQSHTGGLVEDSLDGALAAAAMLISTNPVPISPEIAESLEPHLSWMILYLHRTSGGGGGGDDTHTHSELGSASAIAIAREPPWVSVYLFKACLVAWQVLGMGIGVLDRTMAVVGWGGGRGGGRVEQHQYQDQHHAQARAQQAQGFFVEWMKEVFGRREVWGVGTAVQRGLRELEGH